MIKHSDREHSIKFLLIRAVLVIALVVVVLAELRFHHIGTFGDVPVEIVEEVLTE